MKPREFFATAPRAATVRAPFTMHNNQTWKCIVCGHNMDGKCNPNGSFHSASCFYCYTEFYVDADGTIAACDIPKPIVRVKSWFRAALAWVRSHFVGKFKDGGPIVGYKYDTKPTPSDDKQDEALFLENQLAFWLDPRRWDEVEPNTEVFWMQERGEYGAAKFQNEMNWSGFHIMPIKAEQLTPRERQKLYIQEWNKQWK